MGYGDYPQVPDVPAECRDQFYPWDFPESRRNFGDVVHPECDYYDETRIGPENYRFSMGVMVSSFLFVMGVIWGLYWWLDDKKTFRPVLAKQYPKPGVVHYTFEPKTK